MRRVPCRGQMAVLAVAALMGVGGCRKGEALRQRCVAEDVSACESSCGRGVIGEGGCRSAGNLHRRTAALDFRSSDWTAATKYFQKACDGGDGDGCLLAAQMIEAPFGPVDPTNVEAAPKLIEDADLNAREKALVRSCKLGDAAGCKRLGDVLLGKSTDRSARAYASACKSSAEPAACTAARKHEADVAEGFRAGCTQNKADDCTRLGDLLYEIDAPRALRLFVAECELRGVERLAGGVDAFVRERAKSAGRGLLGSSGTPEFPRTDASSPHVELGVPAIHGQLAIVEVERALAEHNQDLARCLAGTSFSSETKLTATLTVDRTGDVWKASTTGANLGRTAEECLESVFDSFQFSGGLAQPITVDLPMTASYGKMR